MSKQQHFLLRTLFGVSLMLGWAGSISAEEIFSPINTNPSVHPGAEANNQAQVSFSDCNEKREIDFGYQDAATLVSTNQGLYYPARGSSLARTGESYVATYSIVVVMMLFLITLYRHTKRREKILVTIKSR